VPLIFAEPGPGVFANHAIVSVDEESVHIGFYQAGPPLHLLMRKGEDRKRAIEQHGAVEARVVAHVVWPAGKLEKLVGALTQCLTKQQQKTAKETKETEET